MSNARVVALIDMDCFYVQVEERDDMSLKGKPAAVVQYNAWKGGSIIAVNYEARARGVGRHIRGEEAKATCPEIILVKVPESRGKADLTKYRSAGEQVIKVLMEFSSSVERASIDEAYIDLTEAVQSRLSTHTTDEIVENLNRSHLENNFILGSESLDSWVETFGTSDMSELDELKLLIGAEIIGGMRKAIYDKTGFRCSAGVAHNKVLAKLACGINKPNKQTVVPHSSVPQLFQRTKLKKVRNLGGKLGDDLVTELKCDLMSDLLKFSRKELNAVVGEKAGTWLYNLVRGREDEPVTPRQLPKSIGCNKMFNGPEALVTKEKVKHWLQQLSAEVVERLERDLVTNMRRAKSLTLSVKFENRNHLSRSCGAVSYNPERMAADAFAVLEKLYSSRGLQPINNLGLVAGKFEDEVDITNCTKISNYFTSKALPSSESEPQPQQPSSSRSMNPVQLDNEASIQSDSSNHSSESDGFFNREGSPEPDSCSQSVDSQLLAVEGHSSMARATTSDSSPTKALTKECERCKKSILMWEFDSHSDYHFAKDLQRELNGIPAVPSTSTNRSPKKLKRSGGSGTGRGRGASAKKKSRVTGMKTLDNYFTQP